MPTQEPTTGHVDHPVLTNPAFRVRQDYLQMQTADGWIDAVTLDNFLPRDIADLLKFGHVNHPNLAAALAAFQAECPPVRKGSTATVNGKSKTGAPVSYSYAYADLSAIHEVIDPIKGKHGLSFSARPTMSADGSFELRYALRHESGEMVTGIYPLPPVDRMGPQDLGKAITYARRYAECSVLGVAPGGDDDDAHDAQKHYEARQAPRPAKKPSRKPDAPARDWLAEAEAAADKDAVGRIWHELKAEVQAGRADLATLDKVAAVGRKRAEAAEPPKAPPRTSKDDVALAGPAAEEVSA